MAKPGNQQPEKQQQQHHHHHQQPLWSLLTRVRRPYIFLAFFFYFFCFSFSNNYDCSSRAAIMLTRHFLYHRRAAFLSLSLSLVFYYCYFLDVAGGLVTCVSFDSTISVKDSIRNRSRFAPRPTRCRQIVVGHDASILKTLEFFFFDGHEMFHTSIPSI